MSKLIDWNFKCINPSDYELVIEADVESNLMNSIFKKAKIQLNRKKGIRVDGSPDDDSIKEIDIPYEYHNLIKTALTGATKKILKEIKKDKIVMLSTAISESKFQKKESGDWHFRTLITGQYVDKR